MQEPVRRVPGQDYGMPGRVTLVPVEPRIGHRADADAYKRSKKKPYKRKIEAQRKAKGK